MTTTLIGHRDIQNWVNARQGHPAIRRIHDQMGWAQARLALSFEREPRTIDFTGVDDGISPCSWTAWLAELDRQHLALRVSDKSQTTFEFVELRELD